jgi:putative PIN family toxin of toxin-antitoxin system
LVTPEILDEYVSVLRRPKFALTEELLDRWMALVHARTVPVPSPPAVSFPRDPKDAPFLAAAISAGADYLITGDKDLLQAQSLTQAKILAAADFARLFSIE